ncbi:lipopolysaccharide assembly protein LapA domain-containing protein [Alkalibacillus haloalkaliphilus]|uniref:lipopolysaccharide assembly protein LapA domain-containing protein n=1 Tax=Alkalibacillus haloalkaliphilus TaxID=94136 RepID=UPI0029359075|nr:lipopolysaccharide assembly protein LapA domain-containing protein [Alkalibacillus haloalkaliphilus]MDV2582922.1 hypothetical protein [Alkalibacillus haloalkaliphilus]
MNLFISQLATVTVGFSTADMVVQLIMLVFLVAFLSVLIGLAVVFFKRNNEVKGLKERVDQLEKERNNG